MAVFHAGELEMQERVGVRGMAERVGTSIRSVIPPAAQEFIRQQPFVVVGGVGSDGRVWALALEGEPGFAHALDEHTLRIEALLPEGDPLLQPLREGMPLGMIALEPATRRRMRLNGDARVQNGGLIIETREVYSNCPKYIQKRTWQRQSEGGVPSVAKSSDGLDARQKALIAGADTFFIASYAEGGADASHRGGNPGFVRVVDSNLLKFPDYTGNAMFNTLGNIQRDGRVGLLFLDWKNGTSLQISGRARVLWEAENAHWTDAERGVEVQIESIIERPHASVLQWQFLEASPFNPAL